MKGCFWKVSFGFFHGYTRMGTDDEPACMGACPKYYIYRRSSKQRIFPIVTRESAVKRSVRLTSVPSVRSERPYRQASPQRVYVWVPRKIGALASARTRQIGDSASAGYCRERGGSGCGGMATAGYRGGRSSDRPYWIRGMKLILCSFSKALPALSLVSAKMIRV